MKSDNFPIYISQNQEQQLRKAFELIETVKSEISYDYEEYTGISTSLDLLKRVLKLKKQFESNGGSW